MHPEEMEKHFDLAADEFMADVNPATPEDLATRGGNWSAINVELSSRYFRSRARLLQALREPQRPAELLAKSAAAWGNNEVLYANSDAMRLKQIVSALSTLISEPTELNEERIVQAYRLAMRVTGEQDDDKNALEFITRAAEAFRGFATQPQLELTQGRLNTAIEALSRISVIGPRGSEAIRPALGASASRIIEGPIRTWMHRGLEAIGTEVSLHKVLLRLLQGGLPKYAQVRHGPIEYGKDIVVLVEEGGKLILRMYQIKCGDIGTTVWRESRHELEEIFLVPLEPLQLPVKPDALQAVLMTNGHAKPHVERVMHGWFSEQRNMGRNVEFMHLV
jgi:hypothetical protein